MYTFARDKEEYFINKPSRMESLNICGLGNKLSDLISFMNKTNVDISDVADTRRKDKNNFLKRLFKEYVKILIGVPVKECPKHGVGFFS